MPKTILTRRLLLGVAAAGAVGGSLIGGVLVLRPGVGQAAAFGGANPVLFSQGGHVIVGTATVSCAGECVVATDEGDDFRTCPLRLSPKASYAACLTALNAACVATCKTTP